MDAIDTHFLTSLARKPAESGRLFAVPQSKAGLPVASHERQQVLNASHSQHQLMHHSLHQQEAMAGSTTGAQWMHAASRHFDEVEHDQDFEDEAAHQLGHLGQPHGQDHRALQEVPLNSLHEKQNRANQNYQLTADPGMHQAQYGFKDQENSMKAVNAGNGHKLSKHNQIHSSSSHILTQNQLSSKHPLKRKTTLLHQSSQENSQPVLGLAKHQSSGPQATKSSRHHRDAGQGSIKTQHGGQYAQPLTNHPHFSYKNKPIVQQTRTLKGHAGGQ